MTFSPRKLQCDVTWAWLKLCQCKFGWLSCSKMSSSIYCCRSGSEKMYLLADFSFTWMMRMNVLRCGTFVCFACSPAYANGSRLNACCGWTSISCSSHHGERDFPHDVFLVGFSFYRDRRVHISVWRGLGSVGGEGVLQTWRFHVVRGLAGLHAHVICRSSVV